MTTTQEATRGPWRRELDAYARAFAGAFIFGIPLLFTMEMWWIGEYADRGKLLAFLAIALIANFGLNYVSGFRREWTLAATIEETIEVVAVGVVAAAAALVVARDERGRILVLLAYSAAFLSVPLMIRGTSIYLNRVHVTLNGSRYMLVPALTLAAALLVALFRRRRA